MGLEDGYSKLLKTHNVLQIFNEEDSLGVTLPLPSTVGGTPLSASKKIRPVRTEVRSRTLVIHW